MRPFLVLDEALSLILGAWDVVAERPSGPDAPRWASARGWSEFLLSLDDDALHAAEAGIADGLFLHPDTPPSLRELAERARALSAPFELEADPAPSAARPRHVKPRKQTQLEAIAAIARDRFGDAERVVDFGAGHGHLTRLLFETLGASEAVGIDWDRARIRRAERIAGGPRFVHADAATDERALRAGDLVVGLHACGGLGDALVTRALDAGAHVLAVGCCFQNTEARERRPCSRRGEAAGFVVPKPLLGLANLSPRSFEGSADLRDKHRGRQHRHALRILLEARGVKVELGEEARGVPKERVRHGLAEIAGFAFRARGLEAPLESELEEAAARARVEHGRIARFALPRHMLARALELALIADRACLLEEAGFEVEVRALFTPRASPRNLGIIARAPR